MSGRVLRLVCTAAVATVAAGTLLTTAPAPATAAPEPPAVDGAGGTATDTDATSRTARDSDADSATDNGDGDMHGDGDSTTGSDNGTDTDAPEDRSVADLLSDLQRLYREAEEATEAYNATEEELKKQRAEVARLDRRLTEARLSLHDSRGAAGRLARQQYQNSSTALSPYVRLLLARDPHRALEQGHVIGQVAQDRAETVERMAGSEKATGALARKARAALDHQLTLTERRMKERDAVRDRLAEVERLLASLSTEQLSGIQKLERDTTARS